jgi:hypothetical protein
MNRTILLPAVVAIVAVFSLAAIFPSVIAQNEDGAMPLFDDNGTSQHTTTSTSSAQLITDNGTLDCPAIASEFGGIGVPNGDVCDVVVVRQTPQITADNGLNLNQFTLMNSVLEFYIMPANTSTTSSSGTSMSNSTSMNGNTTTSSAEQVYVMGDFALLETEMNDVLAIVKDNGWTVTGIHNHMINETPKTSFMHWEAMGDINEIIDQANQALAETSIKG